MELDVGIDDPSIANRFLRALWAQLRRRFGKCAWHHSPYKNGRENTISFGSMDIGEGSSGIDVGISYVRRGTIRTITFEQSADFAASVEAGIRDAVTAAKETLETTARFKVSTLIASPLGTVSGYERPWFMIRPNDSTHFQLDLVISAFDNVDAATQARAKVNVVLDLMAVETNAFFWPASPRRRWPRMLARLAEKFTGVRTNSDSQERYQPDTEWIDGISNGGGQLLFSEAGISLLEMIISQETLDPDAVRFARACHHFHVARKYDAQVMDTLIHHSSRHTRNGGTIEMRIRDQRLVSASEVGAAHAEITSVLYVSSLEVASLIGSQAVLKCDECGQPRHKIAERVRTLAEAKAGSHVEDFINEFYRTRSKYLHEGLLLSRGDCAGTSLPQLDPSSASGCSTQIATPDINLREYTGFILRKVGKDLLQRIPSSTQ